MATIDKVVCDIKTANKILEQANSYDSIAALCSANGISVRELEGAILFHNLPYPEFLTPLEKRIQESYKELKSAKYTQLEMAKHFGTTVSQIRLVLQKLGYIKSKREFSDELDNLKHLIQTRGLKVSQALCLAPYCKLSKEEATEALLAKGFDVYAYQNCWRRYGSWETLPARNRYPLKGSSVMIYARCLECGKSYWVQRNSVLSHRSMRCWRCAKEIQTKLKVKTKDGRRRFDTITEASNAMANKAGVTSRLIQHNLTAFGFFTNEKVSLVVEGAADLPNYNFKAEEFNAEVIAERLAYEPFPNEGDETIGKLADTRGLKLLMKARQLDSAEQEEDSRPVEITEETSVH